MRLFFRRLCAAALMICTVLSTTMPALAAEDTSAKSGEVTGISVSGYPLSKAERTSGAYVINLTKGNTTFFDVTSTKDVTFVSGNSGCATLQEISAYNSSSQTKRYRIKGMGNAGKECGIYIKGGGRYFIVRMIAKPTAQPFISDTVEPMRLPLGNTYQFKITLKNPNSHATFITDNGPVLSTSAKPGTRDSSGRVVYLYKITAMRAGTSTVYVLVDGVSYPVFSVTAGTPQTLPPNNLGEVTGISVSGYPLSKAERTSGAYVINLTKGNTTFFDVTSTKDVTFVSGNTGCATLQEISAYNSSSQTKRYRLTGTGNAGKECGIYIKGGGRYFIVRMIAKPASQPFISDTVEPMRLPLGNTYQFKITLKNPNSHATFITDNGPVLSTSAKPGTRDSSGRVVYLYQITAAKAGTSTVHVIVDGVSYPVFSVTVGNPQTIPQENLGEVTKVSVSGYPLSKAERTSGAYVINLTKGNTTFFDVTSTKDVTFVSGNSGCATLQEISAYNSSSQTKRYRIKGMGNAGKECGIYIKGGGRYFIVRMIAKPAAQPFISDTVEPMRLPLGNTYQFKITLKNPNSHATFITDNGPVLSTSAKPGTRDSSGRVVYLYKITAMQAGTSTVYVLVDGVSYPVFSVTVEAAAHPVNGYTPIVTSASGKTYWNGIDVSEHQGRIDWQAVKNTGIDFVMLRAGFGVNYNIDKQFERNIAECNRLGIPVGIYWFSYALTVDNAKKEAQNCLRAISGYRVNYPVCYDLEYASITYAEKLGVTITRQLATDMTKAFCSEIERNGYYAMNYSDLNHLNNLFYADQIQEYDLWYAQYPFKSNIPSQISDSNCEFPDAHMWQYCDKGHVNGISGNVDMDVSNIDYAKLIRDAGLNHLTSSTARAAQMMLFSVQSDMRPLSQEDPLGRNSTRFGSPPAIPAGNQKSSPDPGQMSQPGYNG